MNETVTRMKYGLTKSLIKFLGGGQRKKRERENGMEKEEKEDTHA